MGYVLTAAIVLAVAFGAAAALHVQHATRPVSRPRRVVVRRRTPRRRRFVRHPILRPPAGLPKVDVITPLPPGPSADRPPPPP